MGFKGMHVKKKKPECLKWSTPKYNAVPGAWNSLDSSSVEAKAGKTPPTGHNHNSPNPNPFSICTPFH